MFTTNSPLSPSGIVIKLSVLIVPVFDILLLFNITCPTLIFLEFTAFGSLDNAPFPTLTADIFILFPADIYHLLLHNLYPCYSYTPFHPLSMYHKEEYT